VDDVDYSAVETLRAVYTRLKARGIHLVVAEEMEDVEAKTRDRFRELFGTEAFYDRLEDVVKQYRQQFNLTAPSKRSDSTAGGVDRGV
jgi:spore maturation protein CgeB